MIAGIVHIDQNARRIPSSIFLFELFDEHSQEINEADAVRVLLTEHEALYSCI